MQLERDVRYRATIHLKGVQIYATNEQVAAKFEELGFRDVQVEGQYAERVGEATWDRDDQEINVASLPITDIQEV